MHSEKSGINTVTLTCSTCGSNQFNKVATNEYRCVHCQALTLVEDDVAQRLEKILRGMQAPQQAPQQIKASWIIGILAAIVAIIAVAVVTAILDNHDSSRLHVVPPRVVEKPIDSSLVTLTNTQEVVDNGRREIIVLMRNETGVKIQAPSVKATFFQDELTLTSKSASPLAGSLLPGEYTPVRISVPSQSYTRYALTLERGVTASRTEGRDVAAEKIQLILNDDRYRFVGLLRNKDTRTASSAKIIVMAYDDGGRLMGAGSGYGVASELEPNAATPFDVRVDLFGDGKIAYYDYMVQSDR